MLLVRKILYPLLHCYAIGCFQKNLFWLGRLILVSRECEHIHVNLFRAGERKQNQSYRRTYIGIEANENNVLIILCWYFCLLSVAWIFVSEIEKLLSIHLWCPFVSSTLGIRLRLNIFMGRLTALLVYGSYFLKKQIYELKCSWILTPMYSLTLRQRSVYMLSSMVCLQLFQLF